MLFKCNNWCKLRKKISLTLQDFSVLAFYFGKKASAWIFLRQTKRIANDDFSVSSLNTKSFYHGFNQFSSLIVCEGVGRWSPEFLCYFSKQYYFEWYKRWNFPLTTRCSPDDYSIKYGLKYTLEQKASSTCGSWGFDVLCLFLLCVVENSEKKIQSYK